MMITPHKPRRGGGGTPASPRTAVPTRGLLLDGVWRCNCPERPPAVKLQTRNHGVNHGRWFYTCQKDHQHRCKFFLWTSDAEAREKLAVLSNSRTEAPPGFSSPSPTPRTPSSRTASAQPNTQGLLTPQTGHRDYGVWRLDIAPASASTNSKARMMAEDTDEFDWNDGLQDEMEKVFESRQPLRQPQFGLPPRKVPRTENVTSPGARKRSVDHEGAGKDGIMMPGGSARGLRAGNQMTPFLTPTPVRYRNAGEGKGVGESPLATSSDLAAQVSQILESHGVDFPVGAGEELRELFNRQEMKMKGVMRGRDISRGALKEKEEQIVRLNERVAMLESQLELERTVRESN